MIVNAVVWYVRLIRNLNGFLRKTKFKNQFNCLSEREKDSKPKDWNSCSQNTKHTNTQSKPIVNSNNQTHKKSTHANQTYPNHPQ